MYILAVPILLALLLVIILLLLLWNRWKIALVLLILCIALNKNTQTFPVHLSYLQEWNTETDSATLNVMTYNIALTKDNAILEYLDTLNLDILALQESGGLPKKNNLQKHFPYHEGNAVFSRYPIKNYHRIHLEEGTNAWKELEDSVLNPKNDLQKNPMIFSMQIEHPQGTINLITCHLRSNGYSTARRQMGTESKWSDGLEDYVRRLDYGYKARAVQAQSICKALSEQEKRPTLILGDFNDLSGSYSLKTIQGEELSDAWWEGGLGPGFTFNAYHLLLRLDHILYSSDFELEQVQLESNITFSDHYPLKARLKTHF